jgi:chromosome partitioning protein
MEEIIACIGQKGGTGKTTLAINLVEAARLSGRRALLIDTDPQGSCIDWSDLATRQGHAHAKTIGSSGPGLHGALTERWDDFDVAVVDTPARLGPEARVSIFLATHVLVPVIPGVTDVWALREVMATLAEVNHRRVQKGEHVVRATAILNRIVPRTRVAQRLYEAVLAAGLPIAHQRLVQRGAHTDALEYGLGTLAHAAGMPAAAEIHALAREVFDGPIFEVAA